MNDGTQDANIVAYPPNVVRRGDALFTVNAVPGATVYGERLVDIDGVEHRQWNPMRSKLAALLLLGGLQLPLRRDSNVLYLGAASGTTSSHVSDICSDGIVYCVEVSQRSFRDLVGLCEVRSNMIPIMADASLPEGFDSMIDRVDLVYQDIAQRAQTEIFLANMRHFDAPSGILMLKSRSVDVNRDPGKVFADVKAKLSAEGLRVTDAVVLERYSKDHAAFVVEV
jgi:fibrillarin-like pre-rRNA processing protein